MEFYELTANKPNGELIKMSDFKDWIHDALAELEVKFEEIHHNRIKEEWNIKYKDSYHPRVTL